MAEGEQEYSQAYSPLRTEPNTGNDPWTLRSGLSQNQACHLTNSATPTPPIDYLFKFH